MKNLLLLFCLAPALSFAQNTLSRQVIGSGGGVAASGNVSLSYTLGEAVTATVTSGSFTLTQGFQQPDLTGPSANDPLIRIDYQVYPNPANDWVEIRLVSDRVAELHASVVDMAGRDLKLGEQIARLPGEVTLRFDMSGLSEATYLVRLSTPDGKEAHAVRVQVFH